MAQLDEGQEILDGRFKIVKKLGSGAFGDIFKVEKKKSGEMYAAKVVSGKINFWRLVTFCYIGKSNKVSEACDAFLGEQTHPQVARQDHGACTLLHRHRQLCSQLVLPCHGDGHVRPLPGRSVFNMQAVV